MKREDETGTALRAGSGTDFIFSASERNVTAFSQSYSAYPPCLRSAGQSPGWTRWYPLPRPPVVINPPGIRFRTQWTMWRRIAVNHWIGTPKGPPRFRSWQFTFLASPVLPSSALEEHLRENMRYWELILHRIRFAEYPWTQRKRYWLNEGGSHHFAAARYQACRLGIAVPLTGRLSRYSI